MLSSTLQYPPYYPQHFDRETLMEIQNHHQYHSYHHHHHFRSRLSFFAENGLQYQQHLIEQFNYNPHLECVFRRDDMAYNVNQFKSVDCHVNVKKCTQVTSSTPTCVDDDLSLSCKQNNGKMLRKCIVKRLGDMGKLRLKLPALIMTSKNPCRLVLDCLGGFYLQGASAYKKDQRLRNVRIAAVLALEALLLAFACKRIKVEKSIQKVARTAAVSWKSRMSTGGKLGGACHIDAIGLIFLISAYGIPDDFSDDDIWDLINIAAKENHVTLRCSHIAFRCSSALRGRIAGILKKMMENELKIEAFNVVKTFGMEKKFPLNSLMNSYLKQCDEQLDKRRKECGDNIALQHSAMKDHLEVLKSALTYIERWKFDSLKLPLHEKIIKLENESQDITPGSKRKNKRRRLNGERNRTSSTITQLERNVAHSVQKFPPVNLPSIQIQNLTSSHVNEKSLVKIFETRDSLPAEIHGVPEETDLENHPGLSSEQIEDLTASHVNEKSSIKNFETRASFPVEKFGAPVEKYHPSLSSRQTQNLSASHVNEKSSAKNLETRDGALEDLHLEHRPSLSSSQIRNLTPSHVNDRSSAKSLETNASLPADEHGASEHMDLEHHPSFGHLNEKSVTTKSFAHVEQATDHIDLSHSCDRAGNHHNVHDTISSSCTRSEGVKSSYLKPVTTATRATTRYTNKAQLVDICCQSGGKLGTEVQSNRIKQSQIENFIGYPDSPLRANPVWPSADLYGFVDKILENEFGQSRVCDSVFR